MNTRPDKPDFLLSRRQALRLGVGGALGAALSGPMAGRALAAPAITDGKLLVIFLRGGLDGLSLVMPTGDSDYNTTNRPTIHVPPTGASALNASGYAHVNPAMGGLGTMDGVQPMLAAGKIVFLHRVGLFERTGSHFEDQRTWETGITPCNLPFGFDKEEGWVTRLNERNIQLPFAGGPIGTDLQQFFQTRVRARVMPHIRRVWQFPTDASTFYTLGSAMPTLDGKYRGMDAASAPPFGYGMRAHMNGTGYGAQTAEPLNRGTGTALLDSEIEISNMVAGLPGGVYAPGGGAQYAFNNPNNQIDYPDPVTVGLPAGGQTTNFMVNLRDAMAILRHTPARVMGVDLGGFDTHNSQGDATAGALKNLFNTLSFGLRSVYLDSQADSNLKPRLVTLVVTEFGRTSTENGSSGTDHGGGSVSIAMGDPVKLNGPDAVYNCDAVNWPSGMTMYSANAGNLGCNPSAGGTGSFVLPTQHAFGVIAEALSKLFGSSSNDLAQILPGYDPLLHTQLGYL